MTELAQTYLGNSLKDAALRKRVEQAWTSGGCLEADLSQDDCLKSRIHAKSRDGTVIGIIKQRGWSLTEGDVFQTETGRLLLIHLQAQEIMVLSFSTEQTGHEVALVHLGHTLGNHHYPMIVDHNRIYIQLVADKAAIAATIQNFQIPGLCITYESRSFDRQLTFSKRDHHSQNHVH